MPNLYKNVLIAGATNPTLGLKIAYSFLERTDFKVFVLCTPHTLHDEEKQKQLNELKDKGAILVDGDYDNPESLQKAMVGIDVVLSVLAGSVVLKGQLALLDAATKSGVKRFFTSDYGMDLTNVKKGDAEYYDPKIEVQEAVKKAPIEHTFVATGLFTDFLYPMLFSLKDHTVQIFGDKDMKISTTYSDDVAKLVPHILLHPESKNQYVKIASHTITIEEAIQAFEQVSGTKFTRIPISEEQIKEQYNKTHGGEQASHFCKLLYIHGKGEIKNPFNQLHFKDVKTVSVHDMAKMLIK